MAFFCAEQELHTPQDKCHTSGVEMQEEYLSA